MATAATAYTTADIRNVLIAGHGGSGKTTLVDAMLFASNAVNRKGSTADGSSFADFEKEEKDHKHSIFAKVMHVDHLGKRINLIDTPGSPDLIGQAIAWAGPFVMNTKSEVLQAYEDFQRGSFGHIPGR